MKNLIAALFLVITLSFAADAEAGIFFNRDRVSYGNRVPLSFWSPGIAIGWFSQGGGRMPMVWRGDWVPVSGEDRGHF